MLRVYSREPVSGDLSRMRHIRPVVADDDEGSSCRTAAVTAVRHGKINSRSDDVRRAYTLDERVRDSRARDLKLRNVGDEDDGGNGDIDNGRCRRRFGAGRRGG